MQTQDWRERAAMIQQARQRNALNSPGTYALAEAARLELARIYTTTSPEYVQTSTVRGDEYRLAHARALRVIRTSSRRDRKTA